MAFLLAQNEYLVPHKKILRLCGVSLNKSEPLWYNVYSFLITCFVWTYPVTVIHAVLTNNYELDEALEGLAYCIAATNSCLKALALFGVRKELGETLSILQAGVFAPNVNRGGEYEKKLINECTFFVNAQLNLFIGAGIVNAVGTSLETLIPAYMGKGINRLPCGGFAFFDTSYSPNFEIALAYQVVVLFTICVLLVTATTFITGVMAHISYQCKLLNNFIKISIDYTKNKMIQNEEDLNRKDITRKYFRETLNEIVEYHTKIINLAEKFEKLFNIPTLFDYLGVSIVICVALFSASAFSNFNSHLILQVHLALGNTTLQFIIAFWGNQVITESEAVASGCYELEFVGMDAEFQKDLILIMQRSQKQITFTVGRFAPVSLNTFLKIVQTAYSYFALLHHFMKT